MGGLGQGGSAENERIERSERECSQQFTLEGLIKRNRIEGVVDLVLKEGGYRKLFLIHQEMEQREATGGYQ